MKYIHVSKNLSTNKILRILENNPDLKELTIPRSLFNRISNRNLNALTKMGIKVYIKNEYLNIYSSYEINKIKKMRDLGLNVDFISNKLDIPISTIYEIIRR
jgi:hypothetical protein